MHLSALTVYLVARGGPHDLTCTPARRRDYLPGEGGEEGYIHEHFAGCKFYACMKGVSGPLILAAPLLQHKSMETSILIAMPGAPLHGACLDGPLCQRRVGGNPAIQRLEV